MLNQNISIGTILYKLFQDNKDIKSNLILGILGFFIWFIILILSIIFISINGFLIFLIWSVLTYIITKIIIKRIKVWYLDNIKNLKDLSSNIQNTDIYNNIKNKYI